MQGKPWRQKKTAKDLKCKHPKHKTAKEKLACAEHQKSPWTIKRKERVNAYGSHRIINATLSPTQLIRRRRGF